jgi:2-dehydro-3-deoxyphosphogluconate aldolase/(4S)-4-hydroxy-2-oxoglutarate aldolase
MGELLENLREHGVLAIVDAPVRERLVEWAMAAAKGGVHLLGVPASLAGVTEAIDELSDEAHLMIGITGVTRQEELSVAVAAGADFVISPITDPALIEAAHARGLEVVAGATTFTEVAAAIDAGADLVSVHPVGVLGGVDYFREVARTFRGVPLLAGGHVDGEAAAAYLELGALGALVDRGVFPAPDEPAALEGITARASALTEICADAMGTPKRVSLTDVLGGAPAEPPTEAASSADSPLDALDFGAAIDAGGQPLSGSEFAPAMDAPAGDAPDDARPSVTPLEESDFELMGEGLETEV